MIAKMSANVGGQAVLEGVMMRTPSSWSVAVRRPDGGVSCVSNPVTSPASRRRWLRLPVIRGVVALGESLAIGFRALAISASVASIEEGDDGLPTGEITRGQMIFAFAMAIGFTVIVFKVSPAILTELLPIHNTILFVLVEGVIRVSLLIGYLYVIGLIPDLNRVFQYHAAEHKAINAYEDGAELTPENVQSYSKIHLRCGTAFLLSVIAGLAYELIRFGARHPNNPIVRKLLAPGLWLQSLTTREPTLDQVEVSINALRDVLAAEERSQAERGVSRVEVMA
jgi:uncharacterized protein YqhQ